MEAKFVGEHKINKDIKHTEKVTETNEVSWMKTWLYTMSKYPHIRFAVEILIILKQYMLTDWMTNNLTNYSNNQPTQSVQQKFSWKFKISSANQSISALHGNRRFSVRPVYSRQPLVPTHSHMNLVPLLSCQSYNTGVT